MRVFFTILFSTLFAVTGIAQESSRAPQFEFRDGDRVVFLGDTWIEREQKEGYIESLITSRLNGKKVIFRNLAWSADTVLGRSRASFDPAEKGFERLKEQLEAIKPTVAFLGYGMAESFNGDAAKFKQDLGQLMDTIRKISGDQVRFVLMTPMYHEALGAPLPDPSEHNQQLEAYAGAVRELAMERKARLVDVFTAVRNYQKQKNVRPLTENGIHPTPFGYWQLSFFFERALGLYAGAARIGITQDGVVRGGSSGIEPGPISRTSTNVSFTARDSFLLRDVQPRVTGDTNTGPGLLLQIVGLDPGKDYTLRIDGKPAAVFSAEKWSRGQQIVEGPAVDQAHELRQTIIAKNELFFHRWRPENQTYLFGFRRHEQGQNAKEIPMFDPLISEQETKIFELSGYRTRKYELAEAQPGDAKKVNKSEPPAFEAEIAGDALPTPSFEMGPGLEVTLWAENPNLAKPIQMNFDPEGRLWIASSSVYPQIQPGQKADDKILILEDTNGDGKADKTTVFADGLLIPTGVVPGDGGAYVANSTELLFYKDLDGDGRADVKRVMLSGFGTEDTHHILHTLRWGFDGQLYMNQSIYIHSHIETPHGVVRLNSGGILNLRPPTQELGVHMKGLVNSWGHHFDRFGQSFATDGAGGEGINWVIPQAMYVTYEGARRILHSVSPGSYPKFCGLEVMEGEHFPDDWQGTMVTCDFRAHRVVRFAINDQGAGYITKELPDVMRTTNVTFRPIDVKQGPDGALYIADWSNPIIQHGEVDFRDPRRDHEHGRIWKVTAKGRPLLKKTDLRAASNTDLLENLHSDNGKLRQDSRRVLTERGGKVKEDLDSWTQKQDSEQGQLEALWMYQSLDVVNSSLLKKVLQAKDGRLRAAAVRVLSFWHSRLDSGKQNSDATALDLLANLVTDEHPRVRVEAVRAAAKIPRARSADLVLQALDYPQDRFSEYAIWLSINDLAEPWVKAIENGEWKWEGREKQLEFGLKAIEPALSGRVLAKVLHEKPLPPDASGQWLDLIAVAGSGEQVGDAFEKILNDYFSDNGAKALKAISEAARLRQIVPPTGRERISRLFDSRDQDVQALAARLAGQWKVRSLVAELIKIAGAAQPRGFNVRSSAFQSLREIGGTEAISGLAKMAKGGTDLYTRTEAAKALVAVDQGQGVPLAIEVLKDIDNEELALSFWRALLANRGATSAFAQALPKSGLPVTVVKAGLRVAREGGRNEPAMILALARNIDAEDEAKNLSPDEIKRLVSFVREKGDPARGELVYRRQELGCVACHSIGGVGGKVGPDMTSIGASAQIDYLIESLQFPNRKVKEGYHSIMIETRDDQELTGILVRQNADEIVLRDASNREVSIAKNSIAKQKIGGSIMPAGLIDALNEQEQADLYRFLSELGKPGRFDASKGNVARLWQVLPRTLDVSQFTDDKVVVMENTGTISHNQWQPLSTWVDGRLPKAELEQVLRRVQSRDPDAIYAKTSFEVPRSGGVKLELPEMSKALVWVDGKQIAFQPGMALELTAGRHTLAIKLNAKTLPEFISAGTSDGTFVND